MYTHLERLVYNMEGVLLIIIELVLKKPDAVYRDYNFSLW